MTETKHTRDEALAIGTVIVALIIVLFFPPVSIAARFLIWLKTGQFF